MAGRKVGIVAEELVKYFENVSGGREPREFNSQVGMMELPDLL